jgi:hypothetical protein
MVPMNEVVAGYRGKGVSIYYVQDAPGAAWTKTVATDARISRASGRRPPISSGMRIWAAGKRALV